MEQCPYTCLPLSLTLGNRAGLAVVKLCVTIAKTSLSFVLLLPFLLFLSLPLQCVMASAPLLSTPSTRSASLDPDPTLSFVPEAAVIELMID